MKKNFRFIVTSSLFISLLSAMAQPTITGPGINATVGQAVTVVSNTIQMSPGNAGANQTWNLSITGSSSTTNVLAAASAPLGSNFPSANIYFSSAGTGTFFKTSNTAFQYCGAAPNGTIQAYTDFEDYLRFPFTFGNSYVDNFSCNYTSNTFPVYRNGNISVSADGYGTLTTPNGTFSNVLRVKSISTTRDSTVVGPISMVSVVVFEHYAWYKENTHASLADVSIITTTLASNPPVVTYSNSYYTGLVGIDENEIGLTNYSAFPNPVNDKLTLSFDLTTDKNMQVKIFNTNGALVKEFSYEQFVSGINNTQIDVSTLPSGIYFAQLLSEATIAGTRRFIVSK